MDSSKYTWIQTRDGSPTLWNNELSESYRSLRGAFTESWQVFVKPAIKLLKSLAKKSQPPPTVGEFGLGAGTNWLLLRLACRAEGFDNIHYFAIERDISPFILGKKKWADSVPVIKDFFSSQNYHIEDSDLNKVFEEDFLANEKFRIYESLAEAQTEQRKADLWFHDPFGYDVNPDGYSQDTLSQCKELWSQSMWGASYACNRHFQREIEKLGLHAQTFDSKEFGLKRERFEFYR